MRQILSFFLFLTISFWNGLAADTLKVACVGNSITYGMGIPDRNKTYPAVLGEMLGSRAIVRNFGVSARTLLRKGDRPYWKEQALKDALGFFPNVVVIKLGTNDTKPMNWKYRDEFQADLTALADTFLNLPSHPKVFLCLPAPGDRPAWGISDTTTRKEVIPIIQRVAAAKGLPVIDLYTPLNHKPELFQADNVHPNAAGAAIIAAEVFKALQTVK
jgi:lysophospholipase L1-like esterase